MLTNLKAAVINLIVAISVIGVLDVAYHWFIVPKPITQVIVTGPSSANTPAAMQFSVNIQNKPFWLRQAKHKFSVLQDGQPINFQPLNDSTILLVTVEPGKYDVIVNTEVLYNPFWVYPYLTDLPEVDYPVIVSGPNPNPGPGPNPNPTTYWALAIFDPTQTLTAAQSLIFNSTTIEAGLQPVQWKVYYTTDMITTSNGQGPVSLTKWGTAASKVGLPALVFIDSSGNVISSTLLPADQNSIINLSKNLLNK
jgi:hypothetical protein